MSHNVQHQKWRIYKMPNGGGLWRLNHPCGQAQHTDYAWLVRYAWNLWDDIYKEGARGVPS